MATKVPTITTAQSLGNSSVTSSRCQQSGGQRLKAVKSQKLSISQKEGTRGGIATEQKGCTLMTFGATIQTMDLKCLSKREAKPGLSHI